MKIGFKIRLKLGNIYCNKVARKCYTSIDELSIYNWWQIHAQNDFSWLFIKKHKPSKYELIALKQVWRKLFDEYLKEFGIGKTAQEIVDKERELIKLRCEKIGGDTGAQTFIDIAEDELKSMRTKVGGQEIGFYELKAQMEDILGFAIDIKKTSVKEFYSSIKVIEKKAEKKK